MTISKAAVCLMGLLAAFCDPARATVQISSFSPSLKPPQLIGASVTWTATATDSNPGPLTFQFNVALPQQSFTLARDFNAGTLSAATWTSQPFVWVPTALEGTYTIQVIVKDFKSGEQASQTYAYAVSPLVTGSTPVVVPTSNPLVALFSAPSCIAGSNMRVSFKQKGHTTSTVTSYIACHPPASMNFEIAGMYPSTTYTMFSQTQTGGSLTNGPSVTFTTGPLPTNINFPTAQVLVRPGSHTDSTDRVLLVNYIEMSGSSPYLSMATDLAGRTLWYYYQPDSKTHFSLLTRPLPGGAMLTLQDGPAWNPATQGQQTLRQIDLAGNVIKETNTGVLQQELLAMGAADAQACDAIPRPAPVGSACLGAFHHDAIQSLPNGNTAVLVDIERIFPPGAQGDTTGLPVDIVGDMIVVLNANWQPVWYFDAFQHANGGPNELNINRPAILGETCTVGQHACPPMLLLGSGIAPDAKDWLHANSLYYWPADSSGGASGDLVWSSRHQDWIVKVDYNNNAGAGDIVWIMGLDGSFTFNNINNDPYPWFSHQHEVGIEGNGAGPMTLFDNGNTRTSTPPVGLGHPGCQPNDCNNRGMALTIDESNLQVTPVLSQDLGVYSTVMGSAQLLSDGNYFFFAAFVFAGSQVDSNAIEIMPASGTTGGSQVLNVQSLEGYRGWQMPDLYSPPLT